MRKAKTADINQIVELLKDSFSFAWEKTERKFNERYFKQKLKKILKEHICLVEESNGEIIGFGEAQKAKDYFGNKFGKIELILVNPNCQGKGIGTKLLKALESKLKEKDLRLDCLECIQLKEFYKKHDYKEFLTTLRKVD